MTMQTLELDALQAALAGEHACIYAYGLAGARLDEAGATAAVALLENHRAQRARLSAAVRKRGAEPVAALASYALPFDVTDAVTARALLAEVEDRLAAVYADVVTAAVTSDVRTIGLTLVACARRTVAWGAPPTAFPGLPERAATSSSGLS